MEWMLMPLKRYADFSGRSRRKEFWMFFLLNFLVYAVVFGLAFGTGSMGEAISAANPANGLEVYSAMFSGVGLIAALWALATFIPNIAVGVRRLHDRDMSGWWYLGFIVLSMIPLVGLLASIAFLVVMALEGTRGPNRFGADPKGGADIDTFR